LDLSDERLQLAAAFRALGPAEQKVLYLRYVKDLSRKQVANQLGISEGQLSRRTQAALGKLRAQIELISASQATPTGARAEGGKREAFSAQPPERTTKAQVKARRSGRLVLRMSPSLHAELAKAAEREAVSLNKFITNTLGAAVDPPEAESRDGRPASEPRTAGRRWLRAAFIINIVVVVAVGVVAVILLVAALERGW
jgi:hypothetical protein